MREAVDWEIDCTSKVFNKRLDEATAKIVHGLEITPEDEIILEAATLLIDLEAQVSEKDRLLKDVYKQLDKIERFTHGLLSAVRSGDSLG